MMFEEIIVVMGMPRSGTSWLSQIFDSCPQVRFRLSPLFSYEFKNYVNETSSKELWEHVLRGAYKSDNDFMNQSERRKFGQYPSFKKKDAKPRHLVIKDTRFHNLTERMLDLFDNLKMVAIVRHPCGAIHSWLATPSEFPQGADPMKEWRTGSCRKMGYGEFWGFNDWKQVTRLHLRLERHMSSRFIIQRYEDLVKNPVKETQKLFRFFGLHYTEQTESFIEASQAVHVDGEYAVFKNPSVKDRWRSELHHEIQKTIIEEIKGGDLERFLQ